MAAIHAGWRGTRARILRKLWSELSLQGEKPADWGAAIGPSIRACCYQVTDELIAGFQEEFSELDPERVSPANRMLDLQAINHSELLALGLAFVDRLDFCTRCTRDQSDFRFHSYRREGSGTRQYSAIAICRE